MAGSTTYKRELGNRILSLATKLFHERGVRSVKMDDIAKALGISKRTLYEIYADKEVLLLEVVQKERGAYFSELDAFIKEQQPNAMEVILEFYRSQMKRVANINPIYFTEQIRYEKLRIYLDKCAKLSYDNRMKFFQEGIEQGYFRENVDYDIVTRVGEASFNYILQAELYKKYSLDHIINNVLFLFIRGFCTKKGIEELKKHQML